MQRGGKMKNKYIPLMTYSHDLNDYIVFAKLKKNGLMKFKTKKIANNSYGKHPILDVNDQFQKILNSEEEM
jgi:hypothetical protein